MIVPIVVSATWPASVLRKLTFLEISRKLSGRQPAACHNFKMGHCGLHQSTRGKKLPMGKCTIGQGKCLCVLSCPIVVQLGPQAPCGKLPKNFQEAAPAAASAARHGLGVGHCASHLAPWPTSGVGGRVGLVALGVAMHIQFCQFGPANGMPTGSFQEISSHPKLVLGGGLPAAKAPAPPGPSPMAHTWCGARCGACKWPTVVRLI